MRAAHGLTTTVIVSAADRPGVPLSVTVTANG